MTSRRNFIITLIRGGIFASLAVMSGVFINRWNKSDDCSNNLECDNCSLSNRCKLPEADRYRFEQAKLHPVEIK